MNSSRISSARSGLMRLRTVSVPRESIASMALSINAMKLWISRSWSASTDGRPDASSRITVSRLKRAWCLSRNNVRSTTLFTSVGFLSPPFLAHRDLRDAVVPRFAARLRLHLHLLELARVEHTIELAFQEIARLAVQHLEDLATHGVLAGHALRPGLALAVPGADAVATVDHVQPDREGVEIGRAHV